MEENFKELVAALNISPSTSDVLHQIVDILQHQTDQSLSSFLSKSFQPLLILEQWAWQLLAQDSHQSIDEPSPQQQQLLYTIASFNKDLIFSIENIDMEIQASLLFSPTIDQINCIFQKIEQSNDDNNPFLAIVSLWFDNYSYFLHDNPHCSKLSITDHINQHIATTYVMSKPFQFYLTQLRYSYIPVSVFTPKMLFYIKTCLCSLFSYFGAKAHYSPYAADEILRYLCDDYLQIIHIHYQTVSTWNKHLLACIGRLMAMIAKCYWFDEKKGSKMKILFPTEKITCDHVEELIHIVGYKPFHKEIRAVRANDETILVDSILMMLMNITQIESINWFFRSSTTIQDAILVIAESSHYDEICLRAYTILGEVLSDEQLKELNIADTMAGFLFRMLEQAWQHSSKQYKQIPIGYLLKDFQILSANDSIKQRTADMNRIPLLIEIGEEYSVVYDILWTLSFNRDIQEQLRSSSPFMLKLLHLAKKSDNGQMKRIIHGILWNLEIDHENRPNIIRRNTNNFDIMISYSHRDKNLCAKIYDELIKSGYTVWIDYDQMHGNIMDAMAHAIERSHTIIICMSEGYCKSNYCRAEAHYAFQRQLKIVPILLQSHYKPDGWLLFLLGQLLYVDFTKQDFDRAIEMLLKELNTETIREMNARSVCLSEDNENLPPVASPAARSQNIMEWTQAQVHDWFIEHNLNRLSRLLADCNGGSLFYLSQFMKEGDLRQILASLQEDSLRRTNQNLSFVELSRFQSLMDQYHSDSRSLTRADTRY